MTNNGLLNYYARAYNPMTGTWMQADHFRGVTEVPDTLHRYLFVAANPTTLIDALGYNWLGDAWNATTKFVSENKGKIAAAVPITAVIGIAIDSGSSFKQIVVAGAKAGVEGAAGGVAFEALGKLVGAAKGILRPGAGNKAGASTTGISGNG